MEIEKSVLFGSLIDYALQKLNQHSEEYDFLPAVKNLNQKWYLTSLPGGKNILYYEDNIQDRKGKDRGKFEMKVEYDGDTTTVSPLSETRFSIKGTFNFSISLFSLPTGFNENFIFGDYIARI